KKFQSMNPIENKNNPVSEGHWNFWKATFPPISYPKLNKNAECDVVVVGGGIAGMSIAYNLSRSGKKVVVIEDGAIGSGETGHTTAHLVTALDERYYELQRIFGFQDARLIADSHRAAIDFIENTVATEHINCHFKRVNGYLFLHPSDKKASLDKELKASTDSGIDIKKLPSVPGLRHFDGACLEFKNQAKFHPLQYLKGLCDAAIANGAQIFTETHAKEIDKTGIVTDEGFKVSAKHIVVATNTPVNNVVAMHLKQFPYRTYVIGATIRKDSLPEALWWDTGDFDVNENIPPYHYIRTEPFNDYYDLLMVGGEDHATGLAEAEAISEANRYQILETWARRYFDLGTVVYRWSGQVIEPMDGIAYIGRNPWDADNIYIVTGDSGNGMTHGTIAGLLITDLINGKENKWENIYSPSRFSIFKSGKTLFSEMIGGIRKYFQTNPKHTAAVSLNNIKQGDGKIIEIDGKKYGCYCDDDETLHLVNAECTHLKCIVHWNNDEHSWDCPCHGSRFTYEGKVLNEPANKALDYHNVPAAIPHES
ncbi:MAG: FAD-dependent oxidoreductase, partial [Bacteroidota bacterium]